MADSFLQNNFILVYQYDHGVEKQEDGDASQWLSFRFDNIVNMQSSLDMGLYTEGTGHLKYSKGATNPVSFVFRKTLKISDDASGPYTGKRRFNVSGQGVIPTTDNQNRIVLIGEASFFQESSIFEWAEAINGGSIDAADVFVYARRFDGGGDSKVTTGDYSELITLARAYPVSAIIKRNPYKGVNVAEIKFVADSMTTQPLGKFEV
jgi:hypothetical protein